jgi:hypothetical protein
MAHGPGHAAGGVKENGLGEKSAKTKLLNKVTTHGVVLGRARVGSAVAVFPVPTTKPGGGMAWAESALAASRRPAATNIFAVKKNVFCLVAEKTYMTCLHGKGQILITRRKVVKLQKAASICAVEISY